MCNLSTFHCSCIDSKESKDEQDLQFSDLDDIEDEECDKLDSDCEKSGQDDLATSSPPKRDCNPELNFSSFPCGLKNLGPLNSDYLDPLGSKPQQSSPQSSSISTVALSHFETSEKPRIWSLARTAAAGVVLAAQQGDVRIGPGDCQMQTVRLHTVGGGQCGELQNPTNLSNTENLYQEGLQGIHKAYTIGSYKNLQIHSSSYPVLSESCQYSSMEGTESVFTVNCKTVCVQSV